MNVIKHDSAEPLFVSLVRGGLFCLTAFGKGTLKIFLENLLSKNSVL